MEKIVAQGLLYDFYGELLTEHQRRVYEDVVFNDMSLSEIAEEQGISRQGVHDALKNAGRALHEYEQKLGLVDKFQQSREAIGDIDKRIEGLMEDVQKQEALVPAEVTAELQKIKDIIDKLEE